MLYMFGKLRNYAYNILELFNVIEYILFENHDPEFHVISLMGCVYGTSFENISYANGNRLC